jgi:hypothetical protein
MYTSGPASRQNDPLPTESARLEHDAAVPLKVAIVYDSVPSGRRAVSTMRRLVGQTPEPTHLVPVLWRFDVLADAAHQARATVDALDADLLLVATDRPEALPPHVEAWVTDFLTRRRGSPVTILAMWGLDDDWTVSLLERDEVGRMQPTTSSVAQRPDSSPWPNPLEAAIAA